MTSLGLILTAALLAQGPSEPKEVPGTKLVPGTRDDQKKALEEYKKAKPRLPAPPASEGSGVNNGRFRQYYLADLGNAGGGGFSREPDAKMTLDNTFKVKLFWLASRANNCFY